MNKKFLSAIPVRSLNGGFVRKYLCLVRTMMMTLTASTKELSRSQRKPLQVLTRQLRQVNSFSHVNEVTSGYELVFPLTVPKYYQEWY